METKGLLKRTQLRGPFLPRLDQYEAGGSAALPVLYSTKDAVHDEFYDVHTRGQPHSPRRERTLEDGPQRGSERGAPCVSGIATGQHIRVHTAAPASHFGMESATEPAVRKRVSPSRL